MDTLELLNDDFFNDLQFDSLPDPLEPIDNLPAKTKKTKPPKEWRPSADHINSVSPWDPRLILDLAIAVEDTEAILARYDLSEYDYNNLLKTTSFRRDLAMTMREVRENGLSFRHKARVQAESYLEVLDSLVYSDSTPSGVRLDGIKQAVAWGDLVPKETKGDGGQSQNPINIQINF